MIVQYKCPDCGASMSYNAASGLLCCDNCGKTITIQEATASSNNSQNDTYDNTSFSDDINQVFGDFENFHEQSTYKSYGENEVLHYYCQNCGAELITDPDTASVNCSYCGSPMILGDRLTGSMAPASIIPFIITKAQAQTGFQKWCRHGMITPGDFAQANRIKGISGIYVPFWLFDINGRGEAMGTATKVRHYSDSEYNYTETRYYHIYRKVDLNFNRVPADASKKMNDHLMDLLEPFSFSGITEFKFPYLSGYAAEKYNYTDREMFPRVKEKTFNYIDSFIHSTIKGYHSFQMESHDYDAKQRNAEYTMLPVWMLCYYYKGKDYSFAMNGQTGKIGGKPPLSKGKILGWFSLFTLICFLLINLIIFLGGGN